LGFSPAEQSWILNAFPISAIIGIFFSNQFADRNFAAEKFLAFSHFVGGLSILGLAFVPDIFGTRTFWPFLILMWVHCLLYVPTLSIVNSIAFSHIKDPQTEFGPVRMGGTIGWILAAWPFTFILVDWAKVHEANPQDIVTWLGTVLGSGLTGEALQRATRWTFVVSGIVSFMLAAYSLTLPHTPPKKAAVEGNRLAWLEAMRLLRHPYVLVLWLVALLDASVLYAYFNWTGGFLVSPGVGIKGNWVMPVMSIGQVAEMLTMLILGSTLRALGWRTTMIIGILGHALRFAVFAFLPQFTALIVAVNIIHGVCYAFFFATVYIFVDEYFPKDIRASAQGLFNVMIFGVGALVANTACPYLMQTVFTNPNNHVTDFRSLFLVPLFTAVLAAVILALFFHPPRKKEAVPAPVAAR
jgi:MFS family permease